MKVVVAGATGAVGRPLVRALAAAGHEVIGTTRRSERLATIEADGGRGVVADALDAQAIGAAVAAAEPEVVISELTDIGDVSSNMRHFDRDFAATNRLRTTGNGNVLAAAQAAGARRFIAQSFGGGWTFAREGGPTKSEDAPLASDTPKGMRESAAAIERLERTTVGATGIEGLALRYGYFYGPNTSVGPGGDYEQIVRARRFPIVGGGGGLWSFVHVDDAASATVAALDRGAPGVYHVTDDDPAPLADWLPALAEAIGAPRPMRVPRFAGWLAGGRAAVNTLCEARGADNTKARRELGWEPAFASWRQGFPAVFAGERVAA